MARVHSTGNPVGDFNIYLNDDGTWPLGGINAALLADIRRELRAQNDRAPRRDLELAEIRRVLRRIDARLRDHGFKLRGGRRGA
jgi:hypothetical protein